MKENVYDSMCVALYKYHSCLEAVRESYMAMNVQEGSE